MFALLGTFGQLFLTSGNENIDQEEQKSTQRRKTTKDVSMEAFEERFQEKVRIRDILHLIQSHENYSVPIVSQFELRFNSNCNFYPYRFIYYLCTHINNVFYTQHDQIKVKPDIASDMPNIFYV